jgi:hypothetical protein
MADPHGTYLRPGSRQSRGKSGFAACCAKSLWLSGADSLRSSPRLGWKAQPSSRAEGVSHRLWDQHEKKAIALRRGDPMMLWES